MDCGFLPGQDSHDQVKAPQNSRADGDRTQNPTRPQQHKRPLDSEVQNDPKRARLGQPSKPKITASAEIPFSPLSTYNFVCDWLKSASPDIGALKARHCTSEPPGRCHSEDIDPSRDANSLPDMDSGFDADGFRVPPTPSVSGPQRRHSSASENYDPSFTGASDSSAVSNRVGHRLYRRNNLQMNKVFYRLPDETLPEDISNHVDVVRKDRESPEPSSDDMKTISHKLGVLGYGCNEDQVVAFLNRNVFPDESDPIYGEASGLMQESNALIAQHLVPHTPGCASTISQPKSDLLYGYSSKSGETFTYPQLETQQMLAPQRPNYVDATGGGLRFPFFVIECKAAAGTKGNLWVAANQCAGGSAACLNAVDCLNARLNQYENATLVDDWTYSIAVDNNVAQLFVSWKEDGLNYYMQQVDAYLLSSPDHFKAFRKQVRNILDWGKDERLQKIKNSLDVILEENRKAAAELAKARPPPSEASSSTSSKRHASSASKRNSGSSSKDQGKGKGKGKG